MTARPPAPRRPLATPDRGTPPALPRRLTLLLVPVLVLACAGCAGTLPSVQPWEKGNLARPEMAFDSDPLRQAFMEHVYASKEAASGGNSAAGVGCGCN